MDSTLAIVCWWTALCLYSVNPGLPRNADWSPLSSCHLLQTSQRKGQLHLQHCHIHIVMLWIFFKYGFSIEHMITGTSIPPKPTMYIACSPYFCKMYKFPLFSFNLPFLAKFTFFSFPPVLTVMHFRFMPYTYWTLLYDYNNYNNNILII